MNRRIAITLMAGGAVAAAAPQAIAKPADMQAAMLAFTGGAPVRPGKVKLTIPLLVENGNAVPLKVTADSPMTAESHVESVAVFSERNPLPNVAQFRLRPTGAPVALQTRIRLGDSQKLIVVAKMNDGTFWSDSADLIVTLPACVETQNG